MSSNDEGVEPRNEASNGVEYDDVQLIRRITIATPLVSTDFDIPSTTNTTTTTTPASMSSILVVTKHEEVDDTDRNMIVEARQQDDEIGIQKMLSLPNERECASDDDDDDSIYQGFSLDLNEPWERSLFRAVQSQAAAGTNTMMNTTTGGTNGTINRNIYSTPHISPTATSTCINTNHPRAKKMFLTHTESRDYAYEATEEDDFSLDTNLSSDLFIPPSSSLAKQRYHFNNTHIHHRTQIYRPFGRDSLFTSTTTTTVSHDDETGIQSFHSAHNTPRVPSLPGFNGSYNPSRTSRTLSRLDAEEFDNDSQLSRDDEEDGAELGVPSYPLPGNLQIRPSTSASDQLGTCSSFASYAPLRPSAAFEDESSNIEEEIAPSDLLGLWKCPNKRAATAMMDDDTMTPTSLTSCWGYNPILLDYAVSGACYNPQDESFNKSHDQQPPLTKFGDILRQAAHLAKETTKTSSSSSSTTVQSISKATRTKY